jgi:hypothetical protein
MHHDSTFWEPSNAPVLRIMPGIAMQIRGIARTAMLEENPPGSDRIEMVLRVQGVGPDQPRLLVVPYELLLGESTLDPDLVQGKGFQAEVAEDGAGRWVVSEIAFASGRVLRAPEE